jgi:hypothetical protein
VREPVGARLSPFQRRAGWAVCGRRGTLAGRPVNGRVAVRVGILAARSARQGARLPQLGLNIRPLRAGLLRTGGLNFLSAWVCVKMSSGLTIAPWLRKLTFCRPAKVTRPVR